MGKPSPKSKLFAELDKSHLTRDLNYNRDYLPAKYQVSSLSFPLKPTIDSDEIRRFFFENMSEVWQDLDEEARQFITNLSVKLEPLIKVSPKEPETLTMGFEILGLGGNGESFGQVIKKCKELNIPEELPRITFFILSLCISQDLRKWWRMEGIEGANAIVFTMNLDNELLSSNILSPNNSLVSLNSLSFS